MAIVNRTPDSFYDGGYFVDDDAARRQVQRLVEEGADIVDIGAESTRPSAAPVAAADQIARLGALVDFAVAQGVVVSVDTTLPEVAAHGLQHGARMVNSVSLAPAAELGALCAAHRARLVLTHCRGAMSDMTGFSEYTDQGYRDVVDEVRREWQAAADAAIGAGLPPDRLLFDPGLGFTKNARQSLELCARLSEFLSLGHAIVVGTSRKSYIAQVVAAELGSTEPAPADRLGGSIIAAVECVARGASIVRVHDVAATRQALAYRAALAACPPSVARDVGVGSRQARVGGDSA
jgi:dihydropteroate synthase